MHKFWFNHLMLKNSHILHFQRNNDSILEKKYRQTAGGRKNIKHKKARKISNIFLEYLNEILFCFLGRRVNLFVSCCIK